MIIYFLVFGWIPTLTVINWWYKRKTRQGMAAALPYAIQHLRNINHLPSDKRNES